MEGREEGLAVTGFWEVKDRNRKEADLWKQARKE